MKSTLALAVAAAFFALGVKATPAASQNCYTVHEGYFAVHPNGENKGVTLNQHNQVVYGKPGTPIQVKFQACPSLPGNWPNEDIHVGRILVGSGCLTIDNPDSATEPYFANVAACSSNTSPSGAQTWTYGTSDDRGVVYWRGPPNSAGHIGYMTFDGTGTPIVSKATRLLKIGCDKQCVNFSIVPQLD
ncbi:hypothetical protein FRC04_011866 [Tulasnella sp. 424]|nr:hypothetical protein FRC04_011866 [Tulasnella sp. 424]KAG8971419.1 hypothetical protein FRC05_011098 [Tulasnella sp. 425]